MSLPREPVDVTNAPILKVERLGDIVRGQTFGAQQTKWGPIVTTSTMTDGWSVYILYTDHTVFRQPWQIIEVDLQTEQIRRYDSGQVTDCWFPTLMPDGCIYVFPEDSINLKAYVTRLDPKKGRIEFFGPGSPDSWNRCTSWGPDDKMYIGAYRRQHAMQFDPETGEFVDYGPQGPGRDVVKEGIYHIAADDNYVYTTMGGDPYYLYSCNKETREQTLLLKLNRPERAVLERRRQGVFVIVDLLYTTPRLTDPTDEIVRLYRLENNVLAPVQALPPEPEEPEELRGGAPKPEIHRASPVCRGDGTATLWYKPHGDEWRSVTFEVSRTPSYLFRIGIFQNKIIGASEDPYNLFIYDPTTNEKRVLGGCSLHTYAFQECGGKVYFVGYSGAPVMEWDPGTPWTNQPPEPLRKMPDWRSPEANPRRVAAFERQRRSYDIVLAADGRLYVPCSAETESLPGGLLGWYDPRTGESGGIREGFERHSGVEAGLAMQGRYVVVYSRPWPSSQTTDPYAYLVTYDTQTQTVVGRLQPIEGNAEPGNLVEWQPGKIIGRIEEWPDDPGKATSTFFLMDVEAQTCRVTLRLGLRSYGPLLRLPSGNIACLSWKHVIVVDPADWSYRVVGRFDCERPVRDWRLLGTDLYMILDTELGRLRNFAQ